MGREAGNRNESAAGQRPSGSAEATPTTPPALDTSAAQPKGPQDPAGEAGTASPSNLPKIITFSSLVRCGDEVWIEHGGNLYRLRRTKQDKLILTK
jgi:hemin uptake protein HemP